MNNYIQSILIQNYQSHKYTELNLSPGINAFVGTSNIGKTSILRAINWVVTNRPLGDSFKSWWGGNTTVDITFADGNCISREKGKKDQYILSRNDGSISPIEFVALNKGVPEEIQKILNLSDINFQFQLDSHFLLLNTPGETAKFFNKIANIDKIDISLSNINKQSKTNKQDIIYLEQNLKETEEKIREYYWLNEAEKEILRLEKLEAKLSNTKNSVIELADLINIIKDTEERIEKETSILKAENKLNKAIKLEEEIEVKVNSFNVLNNLLEDIKEIEVEIKETTKLLRAEEKLKKAIKLSEEYSAIYSKYISLSALLQEIQNNNNQISRCKNDLKVLEEEFKSQFPNVCPLCGKSK